MDNVFDLGKKSYAAAPLPKQSTASDKLKLIFGILCDLIVVTVLSIPFYIQAFIYLIIPKSKKNVAGQVALITGSGNGIGKQIALRLAREGCKIAIVDIERDAAINTAEEIRQMKVEAKAYHYDIADVNAVDALRTEVEKDLGPVDILVNNAGIIPKRSLRGGTYDEIKRIIDVNLNAVVLMSRTFLESMIRRHKGHIVNMASLSSYHALPGGVVYSTTKFGVRGFSEALAQELRHDGHGDFVHVTAIHPYFVTTREDLMKNLKLRIPAMTPELLANTAIDGMLRNELNVVVPSKFYWAPVILSMLPYKVQNLIRDYLLKESEIMRSFKGEVGIKKLLKTDSD